MQPVILFDGICNLCNGAVQFVIKHDDAEVFKFAALQSDFAQKSLSGVHLKSGNGNSFILIQNGKVYEQSTAALKVVRQLNGLWSLLYIFIVIPPFIRNSIYNYVAKNRYKWFGKQQSCWVPNAELKNRFLK